jgi:hypothetical protein
MPNRPELIAISASLVSRPLYDSFVTVLGCQAFSNWKEHDSYQTAFQRLMKDFKNPVTLFGRFAFICVACCYCRRKRWLLRHRSPPQQMQFIQLGLFPSALL